MVVGKKITRKQALKIALQILKTAEKERRQVAEAEAYPARAAKKKMKKK
jgi:hypothetical protein